MKLLSEKDVEELIDKLFYTRLLNNSWECECKHVIRKIEEKIFEINEIKIKDLYRSK